MAERRVDKVNAVRQHRLHSLRKAFWEVLMTHFELEDLKSQLPASAEMES